MRARHRGTGTPCARAALHGRCRSGFRAPRSTILYVLVFLILALGPAPLGAQSSVLEIATGGQPTGWRPVAHVNGLLEDRGLREAVTSGLPLRIRMRIELWRKGFFDRLVGAQESALAIVQDPLDGSYALHTEHNTYTVASLDEADAALRAAFRFTLHPRRTGRYYYLATLDVETLSLSDLEELQRWLRGEARPAIEGEESIGDAIEHGLRRLLVRTIGLPTRHYEARSPTLVIR